MPTITWISSINTVRASAVKDVVAIKFTIKPKGIRANAALTRAFREMGKRHFCFGYDENQTIYLKPSDEVEGSVRISYAEKSGGQCSSTSVYAWAEEHGLINVSIAGKWDDAEKCFIFMTKDPVPDAEQPQPEKPRRGRKPKAVK